MFVYAIQSEVNYYFSRNVDTENAKNRNRLIYKHFISSNVETQHFNTYYLLYILFFELRELTNSGLNNLIL